LAADPELTLIDKEEKRTRTKTGMGTISSFSRHRGTPGRWPVRRSKKHERSDLLFRSVKQRSALAESIEVSIGIAVYRDHGRDAHATNCGVRSRSLFQGR
jgi:hypothetical protein